MKSTTILLPVFALAAWTGCILMLLAFRRVRAGLQGRVPVSAFKLGEVREIPDEISLPNRNFMNLLELPVLFYVICILAFVAQQPPAPAITLAWLYVGLRVIHSLIHVTYNQVLHRFAAFAASNFILVSLWLVVGSSVLRAQGV